MSSYSRQELEAWIKKIDVKGKVLDIGGSQNPIKGRTKTWEVEEYKILDLKQPHETKQKPDIVMDIQQSSFDGLYLNNDKMDRVWFDNIFCIEVSEYWHKPQEALNTIYELLSYGGYLYISFHFVYEIHPPVDQDYLRYTPLGAVRLLTEAGFEIVEAVNKDFAYPENAQRLYNGEGMRGKKDLFNVQGVLIKAKKS